MFERRSLFGGIAVALLTCVSISPEAHAETLAFSCGFTSAEIAKFNQASALGISVPDLGQRFDFEIDTVTATAVVVGPPRATYPVNISDSTVSWSTPPDEDGDSAKFLFDFSTRVLTTVDPDGDQTLWDCAKR